MSEAAGGPPRYSIVILTYAREAILAKVLDRLADHLAGRQDYELILIDNNVEALDRAGQLVPFHKTQLLWDGVNKGVVARNLGFEAARGEIVVMLDDDVFVDTPDFLDRFGARFAADGRLGTTRPPGESPPLDPAPTPRATARPRRCSARLSASGNWPVGSPAETVSGLRSVAVLIEVLDSFSEVDRPGRAVRRRGRCARPAVSVLWAPRRAPSARPSLSPPGDSDRRSAPPGRRCTG